MVLRETLETYLKYLFESEFTFLQIRSSYQIRMINVSEDSVLGDDMIDLL